MFLLQCCLVLSALLAQELITMLLVVAYSNPITNKFRYYLLLDDNNY
jgi:hypothetical protein